MNAGTKSNTTYPAVRVVKRFKASPERVFDAWLDPDLIRVWMLAPATGEVTRIDLDPRVGGAFCFTVRREGEDIDHVGNYLEIERPRRLVFTWALPKYSAEISTVFLDLVPAGTGTELTLTHEGVAPEWASQTVKGWTIILDAIAS